MVGVPLPMRPIRQLVTIALIVLGVAVLTAPQRAWACAACACGDPTLTALGAEKPAAQRVRLFLEGRQRSDTIGQIGINDQRLTEQRAELSLAWAPHERLFLSAGLPYLKRDVNYQDTVSRHTSGIGDLDLRAKAFVYQDQSWNPRHLVAVIAGLRLPTAASQEDRFDRPLPRELQPGTGTVAPLLGLAYAQFRFPWSIYASAVAVVPARARTDTRPGPSLGTTLVTQRQFTTALALRAGFDLRLDGVAQEAGHAAPDSGGFITFARADVILAPVMDLLLVAGVQVPIVNALHGHHHEGPIFSVSVGYDL